MRVARTLGVVVVLAAAGCDPSSSSSSAVDAPTEPIVMYEDFTPTTWSLSITGGMAQLSITDGAGTDACGLSADQHRSIKAARQIILQLPGMVTGPCPPGPDYTLTTCAASLGTGSYVPAGCAFFRTWDAQGNSLGIAAARNAVIKIGGGGDATSCTLQANVGFLGGSFKGMVELRDGATAQPWCGT